jgi:transposase
LVNAFDKFGEDWMFQQDNARSHVSKMTKEFFEIVGMDLLEAWPPYSPDLNIIEVVWSIMKDRVQRKIRLNQASDRLFVNRKKRSIFG